MIVKPFRGLRPRTDLADRIPSVPYDVVDSREARELGEGDPYTFLHVVRPEIDLAPEIDPHDERVYAKGAENLRAMITRGWLEREPTRAYYVYRLTMSGASQTGILGAAAVDDYAASRIRRHEHTRPEKELDRVRLNDALSAHPGPVLLTYRDRPEIDAIVAGVVEQDPVARFTASDGVEHALWVVARPETRERIDDAFGRVPATYIADGHHRAAAAARVSQSRLSRPGPHAPDAPSRYFLAAHFPASQLRVLEYNRLVRDLNGSSPDAFVSRVEQAGWRVRPDPSAGRPARRGTFGMYLGREWLSLSDARPEASADPARRLDVTILGERILRPLLGIEDPRTDPRIDFVGGIRGPAELERRVESGEHAVAFALHPTSLDDVMAIADAGGVMPPKSTWFEPKLRSGLVVQSIDGSAL